ncbi:unnamed protein product [Rotaria sp. Silwood1]|nr:unnamed protein product [Rotaria sp. Silwood1]
MIKRRAINPAGNIGTFYDVYRDCVLERLNRIGEIKTVQLYGSVECEIIDGNRDKSQNLLKAIDIDEDLRLNILLKVAPRTGIAALIDHHHPIDKYTRFMRIFYRDRQQELSDDPTEIRKHCKSIIHDVNATHIITAVSFGIDVFIVLQLPSKENTAAKIDVALGKIETRLKDSKVDSAFTKDDENFVQNITSTKVYSNITELTEMTSLLEICQFIYGSKQKRDTYRPLEYTLQPMEWSHDDIDKPCPSYIPLDKHHSDKLEEHLIEISNYHKKMKYLLDSYTNRVVLDHFKDLLTEAKKEWQNVQEMYENGIKRLATLIFDIRNGKKKASEIDEALKHKDQTMFKENIRALWKKIQAIEKNTELTKSAQNTQFQCSRVVESQTNPNESEQTLQHKTTIKNQPNQNTCSNDNSSLNDQSMSLSEQENERNRNSQCSSSSPTKTQISNAPTATLSVPSPTNEIINILLLGEIGVGKSTFINAFVNYLTFENLNKAEQGKPVVLIPASFLMTIGNNFDECIVKFSNSDSFNNEDFDHPGQSITQHCKSYVFHLNDTNKTKLRIIDTPGFGDKRGLHQDDANMQHILEYINELTHLNAICFLLKPNASQINSFFITCLTQLLDLLGSNARQNIVFCFTNARLTFYTPGDTAPLLKSMLQSFSFGDIPFIKQNTFCFDNKAFRYLVARKNGIEFNDQEHNEYENSWSKSVAESNHLLSFVCRKLKSHIIKDESQSIKQTQLQISRMIRPMLETMRNIFRNLIAWKMHTSNGSIELNPIVLHRSAAVCYTCRRQIIQIKKFLIVKDFPHEIQNTCYSCTCPFDRHIRIDYKLDYTYCERCPNTNQEEMKKSLDLLFRASAEFAYFLMNIVRSSKDDPFLIHIVHMISEENDLCTGETRNEMNSKLVEKLMELMARYQQSIETLERNQEHSNLNDIHVLIQTIYKNPMVKKQMDAIKQSRKIIMKQYECEFLNDLTNAKTS